MMAGVRSAGSVERVPAEILVLGGIASVQFGSAFAAQLFDQAGPAGVVLLRLGFGALALLGLTRPWRRRRTGREWMTAALFGLVMAGMNWSFYEALDRMPLGPAVTVEFVGPLTVALVGSHRALDLIWVALAGGGVALLGFGRSSGGHLSTAGVLLALLAGVFWACYILMSKRVGQAFSGLDGLATALAVGTVVLLPAGLIEGGSALGRPHVVAGGLAVALLSSVIPYSLELTALRRLSAAAFGLLMSLEPAVAALAGVTVLDQSLSVQVGVAIALVVLASAGSTLGARSTSDRRGQPAELPVDV
jgi:inner membrane transporter RhtA